MKLNRDRIFSLCVIAFGLLGVFLSSQIEPMFSLAKNDPGPQAFPYFCCIAIAVCGVGKFLTSKENDTKASFRKEEWKRILIILAAAVAYVTLLAIFGFVPSSIVAAAGFTWIMRGKNKLNPFVLAVFAVALALALFFAFENLLGIPLPKGILFK